MQKQYRRLAASCLRDSKLLLPEHLFRMQITAYNETEQAALALIYYMGISIERQVDLDWRYFNMDCEIPFFLLHGRVYFMKGAILTIMQELYNKRKFNHHLEVQPVFKERPNVSANHQELCMKTWKVAVVQLYPVSHEIRNVNVQTKRVVGR